MQPLRGEGTLEAGLGLGDGAWQHLRRTVAPQGAGQGRGCLLHDA